MSAVIGNETGGHTVTAVSSDSGLPFVCGAGHSAIVAIACNTKTRTVSSITDSASNTGWTKLAEAGSSSAGQISLWWNPSLTSAITTMNFSYSGTTKISWAAMEVSNLTGVVDGTPAAVNDTTAGTTGSQSYTTTNSDSFIVAAVGVPSANVNTTNAPFTLDLATSGSGIGIGLARDEGAAGSYTVTFNFSASAACTTAMAAFKVVTGGGTVNGVLSNTTSAPGSITGTASTHQVSGTLSNTTAAPGAIAGTVTNHRINGTLSSPVAAPGQITGTATAHRIQGTLAGPTATAGAITGSASTHTAHGTLSGPTAAPGAITGAATNHRIQGTLAGPTGSAGALTGTVTRHVVHGTLSSVVAAPALANGGIVGGVKSAYRRRPRPSVQ